MLPDVLTNELLLQVCSPVVDKRCEQVLIDVPDKQCKTVHEEHCVEEEKTVYDISYRHGCHSVPSQVRNFIFLCILIIGFF